MRYLSIFAIFVTFLFSVENYYTVTYRLVSKNHMIKTDRLSVSKAMLIEENLTPFASFEIEVEKGEKLNKKFFKKYQDSIVNQLLKKGIFVTDNSAVKEKRENLKTVLTLPPTTVSITINENFVKMVVYK